MGPRSNVGSMQRMTALRLLLKACSLVAAVVALVLFSRRKVTQPTFRNGQGTIRQGIREHSEEENPFQRNKPRWVLGMERYKVLETFGSITAAAAIVALIFSHQSVQSSNRAAESARRAVQLQEAQLQPVFLVQLDYDVGKSRPTRQKLRVISAAGTFLDARAAVVSMLVLEEEPGERALVPFIEPYWSAMDEQRDPKGRGVQIASWESDGTWLNRVKCLWQGKFGQPSDLSWIVSFVKVEYRDISRAEHQLYFKVGGSAKYSRFQNDEIADSSCRTSRARELKGAILGRAETMDSSIAAKCIKAADRSIGSIPLDPYTPPTKEELGSLFETYKHYRSPELEATCAPY
jgi:hypothetical protein